jgi:hypothetical protein
MTIGSYVGLVALASACAIQSSAQQVDLSGIWKLDVAKSFLAGDHPQAGYDLTKIIGQKGSANVTITDVALHPSRFGIEQPNAKVTTDYIVGMEKRTSTGPCPFGIPPSEVSVLAVWQGETLFLTQRGGCFGPSTRGEYRYFLSADGMQLTELVSVRSNTGDSEQRFIFYKQR